MAKDRRWRNDPRTTRGPAPLLAVDAAGGDAVVPAVGRGGPQERARRARGRPAGVRPVPDAAHRPRAHPAPAALRAVRRPLLRGLRGLRRPGRVLRAAARPAAAQLCDRRDHGVPLGLLPHLHRGAVHPDPRLRGGRGPARHRHTVPAHVQRRLARGRGEGPSGRARPGGAAAVGPRPARGPRGGGSAMNPFESMSPFETVLVVFAAVLAAAALAVVYRMIVGPTILDRALATDSLVTLVVMGMALYAAQSRAAWAGPAMLGLTGLAFIGTVTFARFVAREDPGRGFLGRRGEELPTDTAPHEAIHADPVSGSTPDDGPANVFDPASEGE